MEALYTVIQVSVSDIPTEVQLNGASITAIVPSLVIQLQPQDNPGENSVIKLVYAGITELAPFVLGATVTATFS